MATVSKEKSQTTTNVKLRPLADRVVVQRDDAEETTSGGIVLPDSAKEKVNRARVIAVGPASLMTTALSIQSRSNRVIMSF